MNGEEEELMGDSDDEEIISSPTKKQNLKKNQCNMTVLHEWYKVRINFLTLQ